MSSRRKFVVAFGAIALAAPFAAISQPQGKVWRIGFLALRRPATLNDDVYGELPREMRALGYVDGVNVTIEWRFADGKGELLPTLADELVGLNVDVIVTGGLQATRAAQKATSTIPIIMGNTGDPVGNGFIKSLAHPGGNITGLTNAMVDFSPKHIEMLLGMVPRLSRVAVLANPDNSTHAAMWKSYQTSAQMRKIKTLRMDARTSVEIDAAFAAFARQNAGAVIVLLDGFLNQRQSQIVELAAQYRLPSIALRREYVEAGGLMSYGPNQKEGFRRSAIYVDKILKGAKPADLPVEQPRKFELLFNGKTAKALALKIPNSLLIITDKVIE